MEPLAPAAVEAPGKSQEAYNFWLRILETHGTSSSLIPAPPPPKSIKWFYQETILFILFHSLNWLQYLFLGKIFKIESKMYSDSPNHY